MRAFPVFSRFVRVAAASALLSGACLACSGPGAPAPTAPPTPGADGTPRAAPALSHEVVGKEDCLSCHVVGAKRPLGTSELHKGRDNSLCRGCHLSAAAKPAG
jgi:predicted CXXCH cytochrome family protein